MQSTVSSAEGSVAVLGNGVVGTALATGFAGIGYSVTFGTRDVDGAKTRAALAAVPGSRAATYAEAARGAGMAVTALPWYGLKAALLAAGAENLAGKLVIDPSNPLDFSGGAPTLAVGFNDSAGELVQRLLPQAHVVKAFNIITAGHMVRPHLPDGVPDMFIAGNDADAKQRAGEIIRAFGWRTPIDMGPITASRLLEPLAMLWISYGVRNNHWSHAFSLLGQKSSS
ncbi:MAG TPA: NAD(P)-binding domain-containing protein [Steroidobacteraceae bacterium]|nr:NAD(P)-binding domain-containing protein [Steroidobacteraceae bacterium]